MNLEKLKTASQIVALLAFGFWMIAHGVAALARVGLL